MFVKLEYNNLIIDFTSQKLIKINKRTKILCRKLITFNRSIDIYIYIYIYIYILNTVLENASF
jgi:hypothetical protein